MKDDTSWKARAARIRALGELGKDAPLALLTQALHDPDEAVREVAVWVLYRLGEHVPVSALLLACSDESELVRAAALEAIGNLKAFVSFEQLGIKLRQGLDDESDLVREASIQVIGKLAGLASWLNTTEIMVSHIFTLIFRGGARAVLLVHGAHDLEEARAHAWSVLPSLSYEVVEGDITDGRAQPFHTWTCAAAQESLPKQNASLFRMAGACSGGADAGREDGAMREFGRESEMAENTSMNSCQKSKEVEP
jgi:hypothetical protein